MKILHGGLGFYVQQDQLGYHKTFSAAFDYAFRIFWGPGNLAGAVEGSIANTSIDMKSLVGSSQFSGDYRDPILSTADPLLQGDDETSDMLFDISTGLYYQVPGAYYFGLSVKNLLASKSDVFSWQNARNLYLMGGFEYTLPADPSFKLKPSMLIKSADFNLRATSIELSCLLDYQNLLWGGVSYRLQDALVFLGGLNWQKLRVGLAYDLTLSRLAGPFKPGLSNGTLEAYVRYCFKVIIPPKPPTSYRNTLYLF